MAKYTFLLPVFKAKYLARALDSILNQTYKDFEIIVSNDNSPEDILSIIKNYNDTRIRYRENNVNIGGLRLVNHWNLLLSLCESPYIVMASDDDIYEKNFLADIDESTKINPNVDIIRSRTRRIDNHDRVIDDEVIYDSVGSEIDAIYNSICTNQIWCIGNYVFKTKKLKEVGGFVSFPYAWFSDLATVLIMSKDGICYTKNNGFRFRLSETNISNTKRNKELDREKLQATIMFGEWLTDYFKQVIVPNDIISQRHLTKAIHNANKIVYSQIGDYGWSIGCLDLIKVYFRLRRWPDFSKVSFIKNYILSALARKIGKNV